MDRLTHRRLIVLACLAIWARSQAVYAQIELPERSAAHTVVAAKIGRTLPAGSKAKYRWSGSPGVSIGAGSEDNKTAYVTAAPGSYTLRATVAWLEGEALALETYESPLVIGDAPPTPPVVVKTLAELAGDKAAILAELLTDLREAALPIAPTTDALKNGLKAGLARAAVPVDHPAAVEIVKRLDVCGNGKIDDALRKSLDAALAKAVADLGAKPPVPPTPPVVEGKRLVVIVANLKDTDPARAAMFNDLRTGAEAGYLSSKGHQLLILDADQETADGGPDPFVAKLKATGESLPAEFVLDLQTKSIIAKQALPASAAAVVEFVKGNGG